MPIDADSAIRMYPGVPELARHLERALGAAYKDALRAIIKRWEELGPGITPTQARHAVQETLREWPALTAVAYDDLINRIFWLGFMVGIVDTGVTVGPDHGDQMALEWLKRRPEGFVPALRTFADDERRFFERVIADAYAGVGPDGRLRPFDLDDMVARVRERAPEADYKIERVVRTETAKVTSLGRIAAWANDPDRYMYTYHWVAVPDNRTKNVSLLFEREGPYEFDEIKRRWEVDHNLPWPVVDRFTGKQKTEVSAYNCRCSAARTPKTPSKLFEQGLITRQQYEIMEAA